MHIINSISEFHRLLSLPEPVHPLVSVIRITDMKPAENSVWEKFLINFYSVSLKRDVSIKLKYGQQHYDFDKGIMSFTAPKQVQSVAAPEMDKFRNDCGSGYMLIFHPHFLVTHPLHTLIKRYGFFSYAVHEALHLSEREEKNIVEIFQRIESDYQFIDRHTQDIILSQIDLLLNYCNRFYERQFLTRKAVNHELLAKMELLLNNYFDKKEPSKGLPSVEFFAAELNLSAHYLSDALRTLTGMSAQQHIHERVIEKAKEYLASSNMSVAEIAFLLGFEYPQSFNKLFKKKTDMSPLQFRQAFN